MEKGRKEMSVGGGCGETDALAHRWREGEMTRPRWHVVRRLLEKLPAGLSCASSRALVGARRRELRARLRRDTCSLSSLQHSSQRPEWEQPLVLTDGWTGVGVPPPPRCGRTGGCIEKSWPGCTVQYDLALKRKKKSNEILKRAKTRMNLEDFMLSEARWSRKDRCCEMPLTRSPRSPVIETGSRWWLWGREKGREEAVGVPRGQGAVREGGTFWKCVVVGWPSWRTGRWTVELRTGLK